MTETIEVELPGTGWIVADIAAQLVFTEEFDRLMTACGECPDYTTAELRAELARRLGCQSHGRSASG